MQHMANNSLNSVGPMCIGMILFLLVPATTSASDNPFIISYTSAISTDAEKLLDVRTESVCLQNSLSNAQCLPVEELLTDQNRLANFSGLYWLLGSLGLNGSEHIAIIGNSAQRREFIAGILFVAGQARIDIVTSSVESLLDNADESGSGNASPGLRRANTRTAVFVAKPRTNRLVLKAELAESLHTTTAPVLLDGRSERAYWGQSPNTLRGGHIPGAIHYAAPPAIATDASNLPIAYAHDSFSGFAFLARLIAAGINTNLYAAGWAEWSSNSALPVDAETFITQRVRVERSAEVPNELNTGITVDNFTTLITFERTLIVILIAILLLGAGYITGRINHVRKAET